MQSQWSWLNSWLIALCLTTVTGGDGSKNLLKLEILSQPAFRDDVPGFLKLTEGSVLNLTCQVASTESDSPSSGDVDLSWYLPNTLPQNRFDQQEQDDSSTIVISPVLEADTGDYECWAKSRSASVEHVKKVLKVFVEPKRGSCQSGQYQCEGEDKKYCIASRYRCDSHPDCPAGDDESPDLCGHDPCKGKILCPELNFRCIDPSVYCCDPQVAPDTCKFMYPCCESVIEFSIRSRYYQTGGGLEEQDSRSGGDLVVLHSTVYTIIGCSAAFLVIVMTLVAAICRLHILRKSQRTGRATGGGRPHPPITLHDLDIYFNERNQLGEGMERDFQRIGITYNINHGVQIMGGAREGAGHPPPYSTNPRRGRGRGRDPPPPYISNENVNDPLLEDDNNNGDINGNSDMQDANVRPAAEQVPAVPAADNVPAAAAAASPPPRYPGLDSSSDTDTD